MDGRRIDVRQVKANVIRLIAEISRFSCYTSRCKINSRKNCCCYGRVREAGVVDISIASEPNF